MILSPAPGINPRCFSTFCGSTNSSLKLEYRVTILVVEDLPQVSIKQNGEVIFEDTVKSVDDLKIFLEERLYLYLEV